MERLNEFRKLMFYEMIDSLNQAQETINCVLIS